MKVIKDFITWDVTPEDESEEGNFLPGYHKLDFLKFDGSDANSTWVNRCEHYIHIHRTPDHKQVAYTLFHLLDDAQLWFHRMELNRGTAPWPKSIRLLNNHFGPPMTGIPLGELTLLRRSGNVDEFYGKFMALSCRDHTLIRDNKSSC
jgi:hypothetical protein